MLFFKQVRISPEIDWYNYQSANAAPKAIVQHQIKTDPFRRSVTSEPTLPPLPPPTTNQYGVICERPLILYCNYSIFIALYLYVFCGKYYILSDIYTIMSCNFVDLKKVLSYCLKITLITRISYTVMDALFMFP